MRVKLTTTLEKGYKEKLEKIAIDNDIKTRGRIDVGRTIEYIVDQWEDVKDGMDKKRK